MTIRSQRLTLGVISILFIIWSAYFIYRASFIAIDGQRYFALFDDAMISMRYAWNLANGNGLVWNPGEYVEGYSNLLMVVVMSFFNWGLEKRFAVLAVQVFGVVFSLLVAYIISIIGDIILSEQLADHRFLIRTITFIGALCTYPLVYWTLMGMETGLLTFLILSGILFAFKYNDGQRVVFLVLTPIILGLAFLTRSDSLPIAVLILFYLMYSMFTKEYHRHVKPILAIPIIIYLIFPLGQTLFRIGYYDALVPNTYLLKVVGFPLKDRIINGLNYITSFSKDYWLLLLVVMISIVLEYTKEKLLIVSISATLVIYQIYIGGDAWTYWRILAPCLIFLLPIFCQEVVTIIMMAVNLFKTNIFKVYYSRNPIWNLTWRISINERLWKFVLKAMTIFLPITLLTIAFTVDYVGLSGPGFGDEQQFLLLLAIIFGFIAVMIIINGKFQKEYLITSFLFLAIFLALFHNLNHRFINEVFFINDPYYSSQSEKDTNRSIALLNTTTNEASLGLIAAGTMPFYTGRYSIDFLGKTDPYIASLPADTSGAISRGSLTSWPGHNKYDLDYSINHLQPT